LNVIPRRPLHVGLAAAAATVLAAGVVITAQISTAGAAEQEPAAGAKFHAHAGAGAVADSFIVVFKDQKAGAVAATSQSLASAHQAKITHTYTSVLRGFAAKMSAQEARELAADSRVAFVEQDGVVKASEEQSNPPNWGLDRSDQAKLPLDKKYSYATKAENVNAYIIDTGINTAHSDFGGRASVGTDTVGDGKNGEDCNGHGTHVASTVGGAAHGLAKGAKLFAVRVLSCSGSGTNAGVIGGVDWVTKNAKKPAVANMSLGGDASTALDNAVQKSIAAGITYALAAGNENADACGSSPARTPEAITVGATAIDDTRASFSNTGTCVDLFAPGQDITAAWIGGGNATRTISGTSMASPHVAGAVALYLAQNAGASPEQVQDALVGCATPGVVTNPGSGSPNKLLFATCDGGDTPEPGPTGSPDPEPTGTPEPTDSPKPTVSPETP
jgi:subtilisin family serine protease